MPICATKTRTAPESGAVFEFVFQSLSAAGRRMGARTSQNCCRMRIFPSRLRSNRKSCPNCCSCRSNHWSRRRNHPNNAAPEAESHCVPQLAELRCASSEERQERLRTRRQPDRKYGFERFRRACLNQRPLAHSLDEIPPLSRTKRSLPRHWHSRNGAPADRK